MIADFVKKARRQYINAGLIHAFSWQQFLRHLLSFCASSFIARGIAPYPINITFDLTYTCNLSCDFCFLSFIPNFRSQMRQDVMSFAEIKSIIESARGRNTSFFLTGGEPLLREGFADIVQVIKDNGFRCGIFTNAILLNSQIAKKLVHSKLDYLFFSLDGPKEIHDALRGKAGSFEQTCANIKHMLDIRTKHSNPRVIMNSLILDKNITYLNTLVDIGSALGIDCLAFDFLTFFTRTDFDLHRQRFHSLFLHDDFLSLVWVKDFQDACFSEVAQAVQKVRAYAKKKKLKIFFKPDLNNQEIKQWFREGFYFKRTCIYPWNVLRVSPCGDVYPCASYYIKMGNVRNNTIEEIWNNKKFTDFRNVLRKEKALPGCNRCVKI